MSGVDISAGRLRGLDLFSGIGGISLALRPWVRTVAYCENDRYAQAVLLSRQSRGELDRAPIWDDVRTLGCGLLSPVRIDIITGGFPCQDISSAGKGAGIVAGERSSLFNEILRLTKEIRPAFVFLENVPAIRTRGLGRVVSGLAGVGYDCRWTTVSAAEVGAPHLRKRWFLLAYASDQGSGRGLKLAGGGESSWNVANPESFGLEPGRRGSDASIQRAHRTENFDDRGSEVADTESVRWREGWSEHARFERGSGSTSGGSSMENAMCEGWSGAGAVESTEACRTGPFSESARSSWWSAEPDVGGMVDGLSAGMDGSRKLGDAEAEETGAEEILRVLQEGIYSEAICWATRGFDRIQGQEVLFSFVREFENGGRLPREFVASSATPEGILRTMRENRITAGTSLRRGSGEQYFREYPDALQVLSCVVASRGEKDDSNPFWQGTVPRIANGIENRVDRLRGLGNAVVPQQAREAFLRLLGIDAF